MGAVNTKMLYKLSTMCMMSTAEKLIERYSVQDFQWVRTGLGWRYVKTKEDLLTRLWRALACNAHPKLGNRISTYRMHGEALSPGHLVIDSNRLSRQI